MNISEALRFATAILRENEVPQASRESSSILSLVLLKGRTFLIAHPEYDLSATEETTYRSFVNRRARREPFQYIAGIQEFFGLEFEVSKDVLIPRPETEILVDAAVARLQDPVRPRFLEIGVGSGCISISVLKNVHSATAIATDISQQAIKLAAQNAKKHGVHDRIEFRAGDLYSPVPPMLFNAILSNPPYVPAIDIPSLQTEVRDYEPHLALTDGSSGLELIEQIILASPKHLKQAGFIALEVGFEQAQSVIAMFDQPIWENVEVIPDLRGIDRVVIAYLS